MLKKVSFNQSLAEVTVEDLRGRINEEEMRLKKMKFAHAITPLENPMSIRTLRQDIARLKTELKKRSVIA